MKNQVCKKHLTLLSKDFQKGQVFQMWNCGLQENQFLYKILLPLQRKGVFLFPHEF